MFYDIKIVHNIEKFNFYINILYSPTFITIVEDAVVKISAESTVITCVVSAKAGRSPAICINSPTCSVKVEVGTRDITWVAAVKTCVVLVNTCRRPNRCIINIAQLSILYPGINLDPNTPSDA